MLTVVISQSGETADTLAAQREAKQKGSKTLAICNVVGSMITREAAGTHLHARGAGDRRGVHQGVHLPVDGAVSFWRCIWGRRAAMLNDERIAAAGAGTAAAAGQAGNRASARRAFTRSWEEAAPRHGLSVPGARRAFPDRAGRRAEAEGDFLHPRGRLSGGRDEAWAERADRRESAGGGAGDARSGESKRAALLYEKTVSNIQEVKAREGIVIAVVCEGDEEASRHGRPYAS